MRSARQCFGWGALLIAASSCLGGQTGQPGSFICYPSTLKPDQAIDGVTPNAFVAAFEGTHTTTLRWNAPGEAEDEITVVVLGRTSPSALDACGQLEVTVDFALATRDHGLLESRTVTLSGDQGQLESAWLYVRGDRVRLSATLTVIDGDIQIAGTILTNDPSLPSGEATFPAPE